MRPSRSWIAAQGWYPGQVLAAAACGVRDSIGIPRLRSGVSGDIRYALRRWRRRPGFAIATILTLVARDRRRHCHVLTRRWRAPAAAALEGSRSPRLRARRLSRAPQQPGHGTDVEPRDCCRTHAWDALRKTPRVRRPSRCGVQRVRLDVTLGENRDAIVRTADVSSNFLPMLGVGLTLGRYFTDFEDDDNSDSIILTWETWQRRFGGRQDVIGERVFHRARQLDGSHARDGGGRCSNPAFGSRENRPRSCGPVGISAVANRRYASAEGFRVDRAARSERHDGTGRSGGGRPRRRVPAAPSPSRHASLRFDRRASRCRAGDRCGCSSAAPGCCC